ncbi:hypothetical protein [Vibrio sp. 10N]|uniref:hypothetical protein n=1 Tax=Vibrio sp. 10N TaxID=3058938 RepID=UPI0028130565|nr:hypothetical protein VB10N_46900 [Vibrio sp. 10N]
MKIRVRHNYNSVEIDHNGTIVSGHKSVAGATVPVLQRNGGSERYPFGGFEDADLYRNTLLEYQLVKVVDVLSFTKDDFSKPVYFDMDNYLVGVFDVNTGLVSVLLDGGEPIRRVQPRQPSKRNVDNVVRLHRQ